MRVMAFLALASMMFLAGCSSSADVHGAQADADANHASAGPNGADASVGGAGVSAGPGGAGAGQGKVHRYVLEVSGEAGLAEPETCVPMACAAILNGDGKVVDEQLKAGERGVQYDVALDWARGSPASPTPIHVEVTCAKCKAPYATQDGALPLHLTGAFQTEAGVDVLIIVSQPGQPVVWPEPVSAVGKLTVEGPGRGV